MKLSVKFTLIFLVLFGLGTVVAGWVTSSFLRQTARSQIEQQARLMMASATSMRTYTTQQIRPIIDQRSRKEAFPPGNGACLCGH